MQNLGFVQHELVSHYGASLLFFFYFLFQTCFAMCLYLNLDLNIRFQYISNSIVPNFPPLNPKNYINKLRCLRKKAKNFLMYSHLSALGLFFRPQVMNHVMLVHATLILRQ